MKVLVFTKYPRMGASSRLRTLQYLPLLEQQGFEFTVQSLFDEAYLKNLYSKGSRSRLAVLKYYFKRLITLLTAPRYDLLWIEKELFPYLPAFAERILTLFDVRYIVDYDDAIFHNYDLSSNPIIRRLLAHKIDKVMMHSECVMAGNRYLAARAKSAGAKNIQLLPTVVDHSRYQSRPENDANLLTVGWIGSPSTQKYVVEIFSALQAVHQKTPFRLLLVGATDEISVQLPGLQVEVQPWSEESEVDLICSMDIGIMPLQDGPWEKGKCGYKLIQYMASGVPVVASDVGVNSEIVNHWSVGFLASNDSEWQEALASLLTDLSLREQYGSNGRLAVEKYYSLHAQLPMLLSVLNSIK